MLQAATWSLTLALMLTGVVGVVLPLLPGTTLILGAALIHKLLLPDDLSWLAFGFIALFWVLSILADFGGVLLGTRWFGGSKWGMAGASGGALVGMLISLPALLVGSILGAVLAEKLFAAKTNRRAIKAAFGAATGFVISTVARLACAAIMIGLFLIAALSDGLSALHPGR
ncbi:MAG: hypothetical protein RIQ93_1944 [Verrucomicrobiota bacterium]|jgi:uncharacterized protein YqgC (DUF456 family)